MKTKKFNFIKGKNAFHYKSVGKAYHPTKRSCKLWFNRLNETLFSNSLSPPNNYGFKSDLCIGSVDCWAYYWCDLKRTDGKITNSEIMFNKVYPNKQAFLEVFSHELIHHYQSINGLPIGHGKSFTKWIKKFKKHGLTLETKYYDITC